MVPALPLQYAVQLFAARERGAGERELQAVAAGARAGRIAGTVVHVWDCPFAGTPRGELNVNHCSAFHAHRTSGSGTGAGRWMVSAPS
ncbi:hypothetical protein [Streptomyces sp. NPDC096030]|uniref:hypothetical protein n=1 Tax=Streptomyces sp. NPDC096030 TaxID=3155423 RepID=UPI0033265972